MRKAIIALLAIGLSFMAYAKKYEIELNLEVGKTYFQRMTSTSDISQTMNGQESKMKLTMIADVYFTVKSYKDGVYTLESRYEKLTNTMETPMGKTLYSSSDTTEVLSRVLSIMTQHTFNIQVEKSGDIVDVSSFDDYWNSVAADIEELNDTQISQILEQLKTSFGKTNMTQNFEMNFGMLPGGKIKIGEEWAHSGSLTTSVEMTSQSVYKLISVENGVALISVTTALNADPNEIYDMNQMKVQYTLGGVLEGTVRIDLNTGWLVRSEQTQKIKGSMKVLPGTYFPNGTDIPMTVDQVVEIVAGTR